MIWYFLIGWLLLTPVTTVISILLIRRENDRDQ